MDILSEEHKKKIEKIVSACGKELIDIVLRRDGRMLIIEVLADDPHGGITLDSCIQINRDIGSFFEVNDLIGGDYAIEVNSPGIDRPLKTEKDFKRVLGREIEIRCHLKEMIEGKLEHSGRLVDVTGDNITLSLKKGTVLIPLNLIQKAVQVI